MRTGTPTLSTATTSARDEALDDVEVVDHQIADHVDVGAAIGERREPVALEEARLGHDLGRRPQRRVEALEMPDLQDAAGALGRLDERRPFRDGRRERLLDQDVDARAASRSSADRARAPRVGTATLAQSIDPASAW